MWGSSKWGSFSWTAAVKALWLHVNWKQFIWSR